MTFLDFEVIEQPLVEDNPIDIDDVEFVAQYSHERGAYMLYAGTLYHNKRYVVRTRMSRDVYDNLSYQQLAKEMAFRKLLQEIREDPPLVQAYQLREAFQVIRNAVSDAVQQFLFAPRVEPEPEEEKVNWVKEGF